MLSEPAALNADTPDHPPDRSAERIRLVINGSGERLSTQSDTLAAVEQLVPATFRRFESARFIVVTDVDEAAAREMLERLERAHHEFTRFTARLRVDPNPLRHKLVCVLFAERETYRRFARQQDQLQDASIAGYYAPSHDRSVFYDPQQNPSVHDAERLLERMKSEMTELERQALEAERAGETHHAHALRRQHAAYVEHHDRERSRVVRFVRQIAAATTVHEAIHQLLYHTGIQNPRFEYPLWVSEGLATIFETDNVRHAFGPDHEFQPRREAFDELHGNGELIPLRTLITLTAPDLQPETTRVLYPQAYALVTWLTRHERDGLRAYLERLAREPDGRPSAERLTVIFEQCFGPMDAIERRWLRHESSRRSAAAREAVSLPSP